MNLLFIDFDGVLHPVGSAGKRRFSQAKNLIAAVNGFENRVRLVISSDIRGYYELDDLRKMLPAKLRPLIAGATPLLSGHSYLRFTEISAYVKEYENCTDWRALDDSAKMFPDPCPQLIRCDCSIGIDEDITQKIRSWLVTAKYPSNVESTTSS